MFTLNKYPDHLSIYSCSDKIRREVIHVCHKSIKVTLNSNSEMITDHTTSLSLSFGCCTFEINMNHRLCIKFVLWKSYSSWFSLMYDLLQNTDLYMERTVVRLKYNIVFVCFCWHHESPLPLVVFEFYMDWKKQYCNDRSNILLLFLPFNILCCIVFK